MFNLTPTVRTLLFVNIGVYLLATQLNGLGFLALFPVGSQNFQPWQFVTYMFMHDQRDLWHIFGNMFGLISFGPLLEQRWGGQRFLMFWMICGIGAGILYSGVRFYELDKMNNARLAFQREPSGVAFSEFFRDNAPDAQGFTVVANALKRNPNDADLIARANETIDAIFNRSFNSPMVGASGALFGILFAFAYLFPNTELMLLFFPFPIKAKYFVSLYGLYELYAGFKRVPGDNVAHFAHLGGILIGFILLKVWERNRTRMY